MIDHSEKLQLTYKEAAYLLSITEQALRDLVYKKRGPVTVKIGRRTFFYFKDLIAFVEEHRVVIR